MVSNPLIDRFLAEIGTFHKRGCRGFAEPSLSTTLNKSFVYYFVLTALVSQPSFILHRISIPVNSFINIFSKIIYNAAKVLPAVHVPLNHEEE